VRNFQILIVSEVKICKQCLQSASAPNRDFPPEPHLDRDFRSPDPLGCSPSSQMKIPDAASDNKVITRNRIVYIRTA